MAQFGVARAWGALEPLLAARLRDFAALDRRDAAVLSDAMLVCLLEARAQLPCASSGRRGADADANGTAAGEKKDDAAEEYEGATSLDVRRRCRAGPLQLDRPQLSTGPLGLCVQQAWLREPLPTFLRSNGVYDAHTAMNKLSTAALMPELVVAAHARGYARRPMCKPNGRLGSALHRWCT